MSFTVLSPAQIVQSLTGQLDLNAIIFADERYALPSRDWVIATFGEAWRQTKAVLGISLYATDRNDCDDFARMCAGYAQLLHNKTVAERGLANTGLAFGEFWYTDRAIGPHAINGFLYKEADGGPVLCGHFEPQTSEFKVLSPGEVRTCSLFRL